MKNQLIGYLVSMYSKRAIHKIARHVGERPDQVVASFASFVSAIICAVANRAAAGVKDAEYIAQRAVEAGKQRKRYTMRDIDLRFEQLEDAEAFLIYIFGNNNEWKKTAEQIGILYGINLFSAINLMQILTPMCLSNLGKNITDYNMSLPQMSSYLKAQKAELDKSIFEEGESVAPADFQYNMPYVNAAYDHGHRNRRTMIAVLSGSLLVLFTFCEYYFGIM